MRYKDIKIPVTEQQLEELKMSPGALQKFLATPEAQKIVAGFEAEMYYPGWAGDGESGESEPDYDQDDRARSIDDIIEFFTSGNNNIVRRAADRLREQLWDEYIDWIGAQQEEAWQEAADELLELNFREDNPDATDEEIQGMVDDCRRRQDRTYDRIRDNFIEDQPLPDEADFLRSAGYRYMSDIANSFSLEWPYWTYPESTGEGGYSLEQGRELAKDLSRRLGVPSKAGPSYKSVPRDEVTWIIEPDGSLDDPHDSEDMPAEIISPPMPLPECIAKMREFFSWAERHDAYTTEKTGLHMSVSVPERGMGQLDQLKLVLLLGDQKVLEDFGRQFNRYCGSALKLVRERSRQGRLGDRLPEALDMIKSGAVNIAQEILGVTFESKMSSVHAKSEYVEFRSAGNYDYQTNVDKLVNTLLRYAQTMSIASDPDAYREEYYKKLYKLLSPAIDKDQGVALFVRYTTGEINRTELKRQWAQQTLSREQATLLPQNLDPDKVSDYQLYGRETHQPMSPRAAFTYHGCTASQALERARTTLAGVLSRELTPREFAKHYKLVDVLAPAGMWDIVDTESGRVLATIKASSRQEASQQAQAQGLTYDWDWAVQPHVDWDEPPQIQPSRRSDLAKRITSTQAARKPGDNYYIKNQTTGQIVYWFHADSEREAQYVLTRILTRFKVRNQGDFVYGTASSLDSPQPPAAQSPTTPQGSAALGSTAMPEMPGTQQGLDPDTPANIRYVYRGPDRPGAPNGQILGHSLELTPLQAVRFARQLESQLDLPLGSIFPEWSSGADTLGESLINILKLAGL